MSEKEEKKAPSRLLKLSRAPSGHLKVGKAPEDVVRILPNTTAPDIQEPYRRICVRPEVQEHEDTRAKLGEKQRRRCMRETPEPESEMKWSKVRGTR